MPLISVCSGGFYYPYFCLLFKIDLSLNCSLGNNCSHVSCCSLVTWPFYVETFVVRRKSCHLKHSNCNLVRRQSWIEYVSELRDNFTQWIHWNHLTKPPHQKNLNVPLNFSQNYVGSMWNLGASAQKPTWITRVTMLTCFNQSWFIAYAIAFTLIACTGILGNIFNMSILYSGDQRDTKLLKRTGAMFLLLRHLAASDLLFLVSTLHVLVLEGKLSIVKLINWTVY